MIYIIPGGVRASCRQIRVHMERVHLRVVPVSPEQKTVPVSVTSRNWCAATCSSGGELMARCGIDPVAFVYSFFVEYYVSGALGSVVPMARADAQFEQEIRRSAWSSTWLQSTIRTSCWSARRVVARRPCGARNHRRETSDRELSSMTAADGSQYAILFQNYALYPHMSVYDNMAFGLKMRKFDKPEIEKRVKEAAEILGIQELLRRKPRQLSGGQRQRVALGRAIVRHPRVFLFDEPLSNLDAKLRVQMRVELKKLHERLGTTAIYVTHDQVEAMTLGDRVVVMRDGRVQQVGDPMEL
jgi:energy-coupling factor transporter ATP-binding protein EcfA2